MSREAAYCINPHRVRNPSGLSRKATFSKTKNEEVSTEIDVMQTGLTVVRF